MRKRRLPRLFGRLAAAVIAVLAIAILAAWLTLRASLPRLDGEIRLPGLAAPALVERDADGLVTLTAGDGNDMARALGFVHAQERFFHMDLARRSAAGELAALIGSPAVAIDRSHRLHRFRARVERWWPNLPERHRIRLQAYAEGVNDGLKDLAARPWPYFLLGAQPQPWRAQDSLLVVLAMFFDLQDGENRRERLLAVAHRHLPEDVFAFIVRAGSEWDAPLMGDAAPLPELPSPSRLDLRSLPAVDAADTGHPGADDALVGSNNFAVAGRLTAHGRALVADDMHLGLGVPNIWFRARLVHGDGADDGDGGLDAEGVTLPGVPGVVVGSNGHVAWAFTNSYGDWLDLVRLETDDARAPRRYRTAGGWRDFEVHEERIDVAGAAGEALIVRETIWGPVLPQRDGDAPLALAWTAHREGAVDARFFDMASARTVDDALDIAAASGIPAQNLLAGDAHGRIAWTIAGRIPLRRRDHDPALPIDGSLLDGDLWHGWLAPERHPRIVDPESGRLWTANARVADGEALRLIGDGGYDNGARAVQIRDTLLAGDRFDEAGLLAIQLDHRALFLERWWRLLRETLGGAARTDDLAPLRAAVENWDGCACIDSVSYRLTRAFRHFVHETVMQGLAAPVRLHDREFVWPRLGQNEGLVWQLLSERPAHLLPPPHASWDELLTAQARRVAQSLGAETGGLAARTWGEANTVRVRHPLSPALPGVVASWLDMPPEPLPGDSFMPRVQGVRFGASQRLVVAPGLEAQALAHMPAGQSGHPLSPYYGAGHDDWARGEASPLRARAARWRLRLLP